VRASYKQRLYTPTCGIQGSPRFYNLREVLMYEKKQNPLSEALRLLRIYSDISQGDLALALQFQNNVLSQIENGRREITIKTLEKYTEFFNLNIKDITFFAEQIKNNKNIKKEIFEKIMQNVKEGV
jgi:DNA-binding XRE family transcriptional regulator